MGKGRRRRRRSIRRTLRLTVLAMLLLGALPGIWLATHAAGDPIARLLIVPATMIGTLVATPFVLLVLAITLLAVALPLVILSAIFGGPLYVLYRLSGGRRRRVEEEDEEAALGPEDQLRRRYVAGVLTYTQFQSGMLALLKDRYARGELPLSAYEAELEKLMAPARHLDIQREPALAAAHRAR